jgi:hypothetical protein
MSQCADIRKHLEDGYSLTQLEATQRFRCTRLAARILDLKRQGMRIHTETVFDESGKNYARYSAQARSPFTMEFSQ